MDGFGHERLGIPVEGLNSTYTFEWTLLSDQMHQKLHGPFIIGFLSSG